MAFLNARDEQAVRERFAAVRGPVKLVVFSQSLGDAADLCRDNEQLVREVTALDDHLSMETLNLAIDRERAEGYGVDQVPAIVVEGARDYGLRFFGIPSGYEFSNLIDAIIVASSGEPALSEATRASLAGLTDDVHIKVFSTPTLPYCPRAVRLAQHMAVASDRVTATAIEATEFPELSRAYRVMAVPKIVINDRVEFEGALPEGQFLDAVLRAVAPTAS
jgi:glutaredoxin-like protein